MNFSNPSVTNEFMKDKPGFAYNPDENPPNMIDVPQMLDNIQEIMEYMYQDDIIMMRDNDFKEYSQHMEEKFQAFADEYYAVFHKLVSGEDIIPMLEMLAMIEKIKAGEYTFEEGEKIIGDKLNRQYVMPVLEKENKKLKKKK